MSETKTNRRRSLREYDAAPRIPVTDLKVGMQFLDLSHDEKGNAIVTLVTVKSVQYRACATRGIHVNTTKCFDAIGTVAIPAVEFYN